MTREPKSTWGDAHGPHVPPARNRGAACELGLHDPPRHLLGRCQAALVLLPWEKYKKIVLFDFLVFGPYFAPFVQLSGNFLSRWNLQVKSKKTLEWCQYMKNIINKEQFVIGNGDAKWTHQAFDIYNWRTREFMMVCLLCEDLSLSLVRLLGANHGGIG